VQSYTIVKVHQFTSMEDFVYLPKHVFILQQGVKFVDTKNTFSHLIVNYK
jgi:predicted exporter